MPTRRGLLQASALLPGLLAAPTLRAQGPWPLQATDVLGRSVVLQRPPRRVLLGDGFQLPSLALLHPDPVGLLAGWASNLRSLDAALLGTLQRRFPALAGVPDIGGTAGSAVSVERALAVAPDLAIFSAWQAGSAENQALVAALGRAGVPVAFVDFFLDPLGQTAPSLHLLGQLLDRGPQAAALLTLRQARLDRIRDGMAGAEAGPSLLLHVHAGRWACCWSAGSGGIGQYLALLGARNIGAGAFPGPAGGALNPEFVLAAAPQVYVATGLPGADSGGGVSVGPGVAAPEAARSLSALLQDPVLASLPAVQQGRTHALWNYFSDTPLGIVALELLAQWLRPERFGGLEPAATLAEINARFAALPFEGAFWTGPARR